jgi:hypothetical protein
LDRVISMVVSSRERRLGVPEILDSANSALVSLVVSVQLDNVFNNVLQNALSGVIPRNARFEHSPHTDLVISFVRTNERTAS